MRYYRLYLLLISCFYAVMVSAQNKMCGTMLNQELLLKQYPQLENIRKQSRVDLSSLPKTLSAQKAASAIITIPVVVHVVYNTPAQNISDAQILSQITILNNDYRKRNADTTKIPGPWTSIAADVGIEFCLAKKDPFGNDTNGITRTATTVTKFNYDSQMKANSTNGQDGWDPTKYLNLWVCNLGPSLYGFAQFPTDFSTSPQTDGVVINYTAFGNIGEAKSPANGGRSATHEVAHWLDLYHIWGDDDSACTGSDYIDDTPNQASAHYGCSLTYPYTTDACSPGTPGIMFMNYMDYGDDACLVMFTQDQRTRMINAINTYRPSFLSTTNCAVPSGINTKEKKMFSVFPNPSTGKFKIVSPDYFTELSVYTIIGEQLVSSTGLIANQMEIDLSNYTPGIYFVKLLFAQGYSTQKIIVKN